MRTIRSPKVAEAPPQTWSNMKVVNGIFPHRGDDRLGAKGEHLGDDMYIQAKSIFQKFKDLPSWSRQAAKRWFPSRVDANRGARLIR